MCFEAGDGKRAHRFCHSPSRDHQAHRRDEVSSGSSSGADSDTETSDHRSTRRPAPTSRRGSGINWEVWVGTSSISARVGTGLLIVHATGIAAGVLGIGVLVYYLFFGSGSDIASSAASMASITAAPATMALPATTRAAESTNRVTSGLTLDTTTTNQGVSKTASEKPTQTGGTGSSSTHQTSLNSPSHQPKSSTQAAQTSSKGYGQIYTGKSTFYSVSPSFNAVLLFRHFFTLRPLSRAAKRQPRR